jgi:hypothetical protein
MTKTFSGIANIDIRDSTPDWGPYEQPKSTDGAPNVNSTTSASVQPQDRGFDRVHVGFLPG